MPRKKIPNNRIGYKCRRSPTTSEPNYTLEEAEFIKAVCEYKEAAHRQFPTLCEYLAVLKSLGYRKIAKSGVLPGWPLLPEEIMGYVEKPVL